MKELEQKIIDKQEIHHVVPVEKEKKYITSLKRQNGQTTYELDLTTMIITEAQYHREFVTPTKLGGKIVRQVKRKDNCIYCVAINFKNADRKFHKMLGKKYKHGNNNKM